MIIIVTRKQENKESKSPLTAQALSYRPLFFPFF